MYAENNCVLPLQHAAESMQYMRNWNAGYLEFAQARAGAATTPIQIHLYSEVLQTIPPRRAGQDARAGSRRRTCASASTPTSIRCRSIIRRSRRRSSRHGDAYPLAAVTQRPMAMYHSWDSQNAWLRQIHAHNYLFVNPLTARGAGHRRRRLDLGRDRRGARCAACAATAKRSSPARCGRGTRSARPTARGSLAPDANEVEQGLPAQPPDHRRAARPAATAAISNCRPGDRPGRLVRRARAHLGAAEPSEPRRRPRRSLNAAALPDDRRAAARCFAASRRLAGESRRRRAHAVTQLALVIDLNVCVGCHACVTTCKQWNTRARRARWPTRTLRRGSDRHVLQPRADLRGRRVSRHADGALPEVVPALRGPAVRAGVPDRRELQARGGRHRARRLRQVHRLQVLRMGVPVRRARARRRRAR